MGELLAFILEPIFYIVFYSVGYLVGYPVVVFGSLGIVSPAPLFDGDDDHRFRKRMGMKWYSVTYEKDGDRFLISGCVVLVGWLSIVAPILVIYWLMR